MIPLKLITESENPYLATIEHIFEAIEIFLVSTYNSITSEFMGELRKQVDLNYLLRLPYPAPISEQKYIGDSMKPDGDVQILRL